MTSAKQLAANRANAKRSTGPKTERGKARSRMNAWKHGLTAEDVVLFHEDPNDFNELRAELWEQHQPRPGMESMTVERLAALEWRLRRAPVFEAALLDTYCTNIAEQDARAAAFNAQRKARYAAEGLVEDHKAEMLNEAEAQEENDFEPSHYLGQALIDDAGGNEALRKLSRYEAGLMAAYVKTLEMLLLVQSFRPDRSESTIEEGSRTTDAAPTAKKGIPRFRPKLLKGGAT